MRLFQGAYFWININGCFVANSKALVVRVGEALNGRLDKAWFKHSLRSNLSLLSILVGSTLFTFTAGPFYNWDSGYEFSAASGVLKYGVPFTGGVGTMINQPPLGFYIDSPFLKALGLNFNVGAAIITFFGLGCTLLVYLIGNEWYGRTAGLFAAAVFAVSPWQVVFSRSFLIDVQCLFFSLLYLLVGYYAIRKDSLSLFAFSGVLFAAAFLTKFYGVFMLVPLAIFYLSNRQHKLRNPAVLLAFVIPALAAMLVWYQGVCQISILTIFQQDDFKYYNPVGAKPTFLFIFNYLNGNIGVYMLIAVVLSVLISLSLFRLNQKFLSFDMLCLAVIVVVLGVDAFLSLVLNYQPPYTGAVKYDYQSLPFLCLLAGSLLPKSKVLFTKLRGKLAITWFLYGVACTGIACLLTTIFLGVYHVTLDSRHSTVAFIVEKNASYAFSNTAPITSSHTYIQIGGFTILLLGLTWAAKKEFTKSLVDYKN